MYIPNYNQMGFRSGLKKPAMTGPYRTSFLRILWVWVKGFNIPWKQARNASLYDVKDASFYGVETDWESPCRTTDRMNNEIL